jgi:hypothetical protein
MRSRHYVVQDATGCSAKGKTIANQIWRWFFVIINELKTSRRRRCGNILEDRHCLWQRTFGTP